MDIVIIGTGNTASVLGRKLKDAGHRIVQVFGRDAKAADRIAWELDTDAISYWSAITKTADVYLVCVSDRAIPEIASKLFVPGRVVAHTAGAVKQDALQKCSEHYGVFYPLQSLNRDVDDLPEFTLIIEGSNDHTISVLSKLADSIAVSTTSINSDDRQKLHVAAVFCNNFSNYLYTLAEEYCRREGLDFTLLHPLIKETAQRVAQIAPASSQTGPARRHDTDTIAKHLELLELHPELKEVYSFLSGKIEKHRF